MPVNASESESGSLIECFESDYGHPHGLLALFLVAVRLLVLIFVGTA